jgi:photosystem II stability/assembly factor-like uncharacterized protein
MDADSPTTAHLFLVFMVNASDGWIVRNGGTILHCNGTGWTQGPSQTPADLRAVYLLNSTDGWLVVSGE